MKKITLIPFLAISLLAFEQKTTLSLEYISYQNYSDETLLDGMTQISFEKENFTTNLSLKYLYSTQYKAKRSLYIDELYISDEEEDYLIEIGKTIKFWGELEGYNIADIYNQKDYLIDPFDKDKKLGSLGGEFRYYFDENYLTFGIKLYEEDKELPTQDMPYYPFKNFKYNETLELTKKRTDPTLYLLYNFSTQESFDSESKIILYSGYDSKRDIIPMNTTTVTQYAYRVNKLLFLSHLIYEDYIFKTELSYTDIVDNKNMHNYAQTTFGVERGFYDVVGTDVTLYEEYYNYTHTKDVDVAEIYDNDIFSAIKINFNNPQNSELKMGVLYDIGTDEKIYKAELSSRLFDTIVCKAEYLRVTHTDRIKATLSYLF